MNDTAIAPDCACHGFPFVQEPDPAPSYGSYPAWTCHCDEAGHRQLVETQPFWYVVTQTLENRP